MCYLDNNNYIWLGNHICDTKPQTVSRKTHIWFYTTVTLTDKLPKHFKEIFNGGNEEIVDGNIRGILFDIKRIWFCIQK